MIFETDSGDDKRTVMVESLHQNPRDTAEMSTVWFPDARFALFALNIIRVGEKRVRLFVLGQSQHYSGECSYFDFSYSVMGVNHHQRAKPKHDTQEGFENRMLVHLVEHLLHSLSYHEIEDNVEDLKHSDSRTENTTISCC